MKLTVSVTAPPAPGEEPRTESATLEIADDAPAKHVEEMASLTAYWLTRKAEGERRSPTPVQQGGRG